MAYRAPVEDIAFILQSVVPLAPVAEATRARVREAMVGAGLLN